MRLKAQMSVSTVSQQLGEPTVSPARFMSKRNPVSFAKNDGPHPFKQQLLGTWGGCVRFVLVVAVRCMVVCCLRVFGRGLMLL